MFSGELRTIHDVLYRPQQTPEEPVLEGILATLAAALQELGDLLACGAPADRSRCSVNQLAAMARRAPRYSAANACRRPTPITCAEWMNRVKAQAARLE